MAARFPREDRNLSAVRLPSLQGHDRFINTGPHFTITGTLYVDYDFAISEDVPPHPGVSAAAQLPRVCVFF